MPDNWIKSLVELIRDALLPEVRDLKADVREGRAEVKALDTTVDSLAGKVDALGSKVDHQELTAKARHDQLVALLEASRSQAELASYREIARVSERFAVRENSMQQRQ